MSRKAVKKEKKAKEKKLPLSRIISNTFYIIRYASKAERGVLWGYLIPFCLSYVGMVALDTWFTMLIIEMLYDETASLNTTLCWLFGGLAIAVIESGCMAFTSHYLKLKVIRLAGSVQHSLLEKAASIDLMCYDRPEYYDDFIVAASSSEKMISEAVFAVGRITADILVVFTAGSLLATINPIIALFPLAGFIINLVTRFAITRLETQFDLEKRRVRRKADYSKRVFYQPEYAKELRLSGVAEPLRRQFEEAIAEERKIARSYGIKISLLSLVNWICVFTLLGFFAVPMALAYLALRVGSIALGGVVSANQAADSISDSLDELNYALMSFNEVGLYADRFRRFIDYKVNIEGGESSVPMPEGRQTLEICDVGFRYDGCERFALRHITMTIRPGEKIAIVGENGAGKSTFVKLIMRLYDVTEGSILYGGVDIRKLPVREYRARIASVFQDFQIYAATLAENEVMGEREGYDDARLAEALRMADFGGKLSALPGGLDTELTREFSEEGTALSGGEGQKVAISRMLLRGENLDVAILDEPSSALDPIAEYKLNLRMMDNARESTVIFISHRLSTTRSADRVYMFEQGGVVESGTHEELMARGGGYAGMFEKQAYYYVHGEE